MKSYILLSAVGIASVFIEDAKAGELVPQPSVAHQDCMTWAGTQANPAVAEQFCTDRKACNEQQSNNHEEWAECDLRAKNKFYAAIGGESRQPSGGGSGNTTSAVTNVADSEYFNPADRKGWEYSKGE